MDKELCCISSAGLVYSVIRDDILFSVSKGEDFVGGLTNPLKTVDDTVGGMNRKHMHQMLDEWIDNAMQEKNNG